MAITPTLTLKLEETRPNTDVPFWAMTETDLAHYQESLGLLEHIETLSSDNLVRTKIIVIPQPTSFFTLISEDPNLADQRTRNRAHNAEHGITSGPLEYRVDGTDGSVITVGTIAS